MQSVERKIVRKFKRAMERIGKKKDTNKQACVFLADKLC